MKKVELILNALSYLIDHFRRPDFSKTFRSILYLTAIEYFQDIIKLLSKEKSLFSNYYFVQLSMMSFPK